MAASRTGSDVIVTGRQDQQQPVGECRIEEYIKIPFRYDTESRQVVRKNAGDSCQQQPPSFVMRLADDPFIARELQRQQQDQPQQQQPRLSSGEPWWTADGPDADLQRAMQLCTEAPKLKRDEGCAASARKQPVGATCQETITGCARSTSADARTAADMSAETEE